MIPNSNLLYSISDTIDVNNLNIQIIVKYSEITRLWQMLSITSVFNIDNLIVSLIISFLIMVAFNNWLPKFMKI